MKKFTAIRDRFFKQLGECIGKKAHTIRTLKIRKFNNCYFCIFSTCPRCITLINFKKYTKQKDSMSFKLISKHSTLRLIVRISNVAVRRTFRHFVCLSQSDGLSVVGIVNAFGREFCSSLSLFLSL